MKWIVLEDNSKPDEYIAVMVTDEDRKLQLQGKASSTYLNGDEALNRARDLRYAFGVKMIRIFHWESHSSTA